jgi:hypothetical protein
MYCLGKVIKFNERRPVAMSVVVVLPSSAYLFTVGVEFFLFSLDHIQTHTAVGRAPLDEGSAHRRDLYLTTQTLYKRQTPMSLVGFEPTIPARARPHTYALDRAASVVSSTKIKSVSVQHATKFCFLYRLTCFDILQVIFSFTIS